jgi:Raf kinase inhibitor-like YbhB/YbcL family protein
MKLAKSQFAAAVFLLSLVASPVLSAQSWYGFNVTSQTFQANHTLPLRTIFNNVTNGVNACTPNGAIGGDMSPELTWTPVRGAKSYTVILFDETASFTHWGIYNIAPAVTALPANAGVNGTTFGAQITNDFGDAQYDGPCPPPGLVHKYVFTVYALDTTLELPGTATFPNNAETLLRALLGHVIEKTSIEGNYASTPQ